MPKKPTKKPTKQIATLTHDEASRKNIPTAEFQSVLARDQSPIQVAYERRNKDLDPQLVWRGKDTQDWSDLIVPAPPLFIQEKVHPKVLIDDLLRQSRKAATKKPQTDAVQVDLFADFNGLPSPDAKTEFYQHDANWSNRMILGDSLKVMSSLAEREGLRGQVQCIYLDPPYGIKFNSNFQWSTTSRDVKDGNTDHITREPEQVKAFRDTWKDGIHSYLTYLRDRLTVARDLLTESGSIFVQIGDENVHRVRAVMEEVFGPTQHVATIAFKKTGGQSSAFVASVLDNILWFAKDIGACKFRQLYLSKSPGDEGATNYSWIEEATGRRRPITASETFDEIVANESLRVMQPYPMFSDGKSSRDVPFRWRLVEFAPSSNAHWKTHAEGLTRIDKSDRFLAQGKTLRFVNYLSDYSVTPLINMWTDTQISGFGSDRIYVVQTLPKVIERCLLMTTDPGDLVLDPTCGSGTTAYVAEQWGRRWITIDTSRVALALARARIMGARYPFYLLADSRDGQIKEAELTKSVPSERPVRGDIRQGFVYERVPHVTLKSIANNAEIDVIWERWQERLEPLREALNGEVKKSWEEWEIPREGDPAWSAKAAELHRKWWEARIGRQREIDGSIAAKAEYEFLFDRPYDDKGKVRVAGPFTVESLSPHRELGVDEDDELIDLAEKKLGYEGATDFGGMILESLRVAGVQQAHKEDRIAFTSLTGWPGKYIGGEGRYLESGVSKRAGIFIGPEFGTVSRVDLIAAAKECGDADFDVLIACAFNFDVHTTDFAALGRLPVLKARMNADLHMAEDLKNTGKGNLFVVFGEPDLTILPEADGLVRVRVNGVDVFDPRTGEIRSDGADGIACWFIDTDYNEESFFVRQAYFLGANDPYKALKTTLKAEIDEEAWASLHSDVSRPFEKPASGRIAVKVINHLGDEVMKVFRV